MLMIIHALILRKKLMKDPKFKAGDQVRISKYKKIFAKGYTPNWSEEVFVVSRIKNTVSWWGNYWNILWKRTTND